jgi:uncharacterized protein (TIGR00369 family)
MSSSLESSNYPDLLGITLTEITGSRVVGELEADERHHQPYGVVHGGVYCSIVETLGSVGGAMWAMDRGMAGVVGVSNQTDFFRPHRRGLLTATATPIMQGRTQQVWLVDITNAASKLVAHGKLRVQNIAELPS